MKLRVNTFTRHTVWSFTFSHFYIEMCRLSCFCVPSVSDSDEDFVTFSSTIELMEAVKHSPDGVLRLFVKPTAQTGNEDNSTPSQGASGESWTCFTPPGACLAPEGYCFGLHVSVRPCVRV